MNLFNWRKKPAEPPPPPRAPAAIPPGQRVYAIGDIHGRFDLLERLLRQIEADDQARGPAETHVVLLGDLIDRGPQSREIVDFFLHGPPAFARFHYIMGNHEEMLLQLIDDPDLPEMLHYLRYGGRELFESYGAPRMVLDVPDRFTPDTLPSYVPETHRAFFRAMHDGVQFGDYFLTHAGIRPGVALAQQERQDLRWIRAPFLDSADDHGAVVVHGHTVRNEVEILPNRIGIDTGAYMTGVLTALGLEGTEQWLLQTRPGS
ncbi:metallophosphoesterase family protein [Sphingomonas crusticola]|uniref:metallophosphoesterase family protein n=1 Tax=Sphingomonas crusticola TaxID=1697973 RepID=UPI000E263D91|nr:metallophosphoesterase family protein [Sphingomonas crusticola]